MAATLPPSRRGLLASLVGAAGHGFKPWSGPAPPLDPGRGALPRLALAPGATPGLRPEAGQAWLIDLARRDGEAACARLGAWLVQDVPGRGPDWEHPTDAALRALRWPLALRSVGAALDPDLPARLAGSARAHAQALRAALLLGPPDHRRVLAAAGLTAVGLCFPGLPEARACWSEGLSALGRALPAQLLADGAPARGGPAQLRLALEAARLALDLAEAAGVAPPASLAPALARGALFLRSLVGDVSGLPALGAAAPEGLSLDPCAGLVDAGPLAPASGWRVLTHRGGGWAMAHGRVRGGPSRVILCPGGAPPPMGHADGGQVLWDLDDGEVLADPGDDGGLPARATAADHGLPGPVRGLRLDTARVDGRKATLAASGALGALTWRRSVRVDGARLILSDRLEGRGAQPLDLRLHLGPGWDPRPVAEGVWLARRGDRELELRVDEGPLRWTLRPGELARPDGRREVICLCGQGSASAGLAFRLRLEVRQAP